MQPCEHPEFFRLPPPPGRSRESTIVLGADGYFRHDGDVFAHRLLESAMHKWIRRHPDDGRYILANAYDWTYFQVESTPFFVRHLGAPRGVRALPSLVLSDGTETECEPEQLAVGADDALVAWVKHASPGGPYQAKFSRFAQAALAPYLELTASGFALVTAQGSYPIAGAVHSEHA